MCDFPKRIENNKPKFLFHFFIFIMSVICTSSFMINSNATPRTELGCISPIQTFNNITFENAVLGVPYPEFISFEYIPESHLMVFKFFNLTDEDYKNHKYISTNNTEPLNSTCESALLSINYFGYFTSFPDYVLLIVCGNSTHETVYHYTQYWLDFDYLIKVEKDIIKQSNTFFEEHPLTLTYLQSGTYNSKAIIFKDYKSKDPKKSSFFMQYQSKSVKPLVVNYEEIMRNLHEEYSNATVLDYVLAVGEGGMEHAFALDKQGLYLGQYPFISSNLNEVSKETFETPLKQRKLLFPFHHNKNDMRILKIAKMCWTSSVAVLSQIGGEFNVFFAQTLENNEILERSEAKQINLNIQGSDCEFFSIGIYAICSLRDNKTNEIIWHITWINGTSHIDNLSFNWGQMQGKPFVPEDLCSSSSFYWGNKKYQINAEYISKIEESKSEVAEYVMVNRKLGMQGSIESFAEIEENIMEPSGANLMVESKISELTSTYYECSNSDCQERYRVEGYKIKRSEIISQLIKNGDSSTTSVVSILLTLSENNTNFSYTSFKFYQKQMGKPFMEKLRSITFPMELISFSYLKSNLCEYTDQLLVSYIGKTPIEKSANSQILLNRTGSLSEETFRYAYEFESPRFEHCVILSRFPSKLHLNLESKTKILMLRENEREGVAIQIVGYRFDKTYVLEHTHFYPEYSKYKCECRSDGFIVYSQNEKKVVVFTHYLHKMLELVEVSFDSLQHNTKYIFLRKGNDIEIRSILDSGVIVGVIKNQVSPIIVDKRSSGFLRINADEKEFVYNNFVKQKSD